MIAYKFFFRTGMNSTASSLRQTYEIGWSYNLNHDCCNKLKTLRDFSGCYTAWFAHEKKLETNCIFGHVHEPVMKLTNLRKIMSDPYLADFNLLKEKSWKIAISLNEKMVTLTPSKRLLSWLLNAVGVFFFQSWRFPSVWRIAKVLFRPVILTIAQG